MARTKCGLWESSSLKLKLPLASVLVRATSSIPWPRPNRMTSSPAAALPVVPFLTVPVRDCAMPNEESRKIVTAIWNFRQRSFKATSQGDLRQVANTFEHSASAKEQSTERKLQLERAVCETPPPLWLPCSPPKSRRGRQGTPRSFSDNHWEDFRRQRSRQNHWLIPGEHP